MLVDKAAKIGWIGTGVMGKSQAGYLLKNGLSVSVFNRTPSKADDLLVSGAVFKSVKDIAKESDYLFLMLGYPKDIETIVFDEQDGLLRHMKPGSVLIDHTTSSPGLAIRIANECKMRNIDSIDAPVSGGDIGARNGALVTMCGGDVKAFERTKPYMDLYSAQVKLMGGPGAGQHTKATNQIMIASSMIGTVEALIYGHKAGLDLNEVLTLLSQGAAYSFTMSKLGPRMLKRDFEAGFYVEHFVKDLGIVLEEARRMNISLPGTALASQFYAAYVAQGGSRNGTQGLLTVFEKLNNMEIHKYDL
jgi:3-hydroxyisobutyrate dehydrogenase